MSEDTKEIILAILKYLNDSLDEERIDFSKVNEESLGITHPKYCRILSMLVEEGFVKGFIKVHAPGVPYNQYKSKTPRITIKGIDYLDQNKSSSKVYDILKEIRDWIPGY